MPLVEGYSSEVSVLPGGDVHLHVSTNPAAPYRIKVFRLGWYNAAGGRLYECIPQCEGSKLGVPEPHPEPEPQTGEVRAGWPVTDVVHTTTMWPSGYYLARIELVNSDAPPSRAVFVVRELPFQPSQILVIAPVNTWEAYNFWGGKSLYNVISTNGVRANRVSFDRPWSVGSQNQFFAWSLQFVRFLERAGYDVSYTTDVDVDRDPAELNRHRLVIVAGHGEYWTSTIRDALQNARDSGTNLAFMGANIGYWQVRYEDGRRTIVSYKSKDDPVQDTRLISVLFRELSPPRFECELEGVQHQDHFRRSTDPQIPYTVTNAALTDPWFAGTGLHPGDTLPDLVGPEWDQVIGPDRTPTCSLPGLTVLFRYDGPLGEADAVRYTAGSGARVFSAGSLQFVWGLDTFGADAYGHADPPDPRLQRFMRNALDDLTRPPPPISLTTVRSANRVLVRVALHPDGRLDGVLVVRHAGAGDFALGDRGVTVICRRARIVCADRRPPAGQFRYAAVTVDRWANSQPVYSVPLR